MTTQQQNPTTTAIPCPEWCTVDHTGDRPGQSFHAGAQLGSFHPAEGEAGPLLAQADTTTAQAGVIVRGTFYPPDQACDLGRALIELGEQLGGGSAFQQVSPAMANQDIPIKRMPKTTRPAEENGHCPPWCAEHEQLPDEMGSYGQVAHLLVLARSGPWVMTLSTHTGVDDDGVWGPERSDVTLSRELQPGEPDVPLSGMGVELVNADLEVLRVVAEGAAAAVRALS